VNKFLFALKFSLLSVLTPIFVIQPSDLAIASTSSTSSNQMDALDALPASLLEKTFQVRDKLNLEFDGSEAAQGIERKSESWNRLLFQNTQNWRAFREYPFKHMSREILRLHGSDYVLSSREGRVLSKHSFSSSAWMEIVLSPYRIAKKLNLAPQGMSFSEFWKNIHEMQAPARSPSGNTLIAEKNGATSRVLIEGYYVHDGRTKVRIKQEWSLEVGVQVSEKELLQPLMGGSS